uniref:Uncharacterized protein n=1 Tax=Lepeophtheirus salmonis TaxID=72036 RepID=A0A0K2TWB9_LEPSM
MILLMNLLIRTCRIYLENDFINASYKTVAIFTYIFSMSLLNYVEISNQSVLCSCFRKLFKDLEEGKMENLKV